MTSGRRLEGSVSLDAGRDPSLDSSASTETRLVLVLVSLLTLGLVDSQVIAPLLPEIARSLGTTDAWVGRTVSGYAVAAAIAALLVGPLSDRGGRRRFLVAAAALMGLSSTLVVLTTSFLGFGLARIATGAGAGIISALVVAAIADAVPYERRGRTMGWVAGAYFAAPILGVPLAAWVADTISWRANYAAFAALAGLLAFAVQGWFREAERTRPDRSAARSYRTFLRSRSTAAGALSAFFVTGGLTGFLLFLGAFLRQERGLSLTEVGLVFLLSGIMSLAGALGAGRVADRLGKIRVALAGSLALSALLLAVPYAPGVLLYAALGLVGLAAAARVAPLQSLITELVPPESRGAYVALRNTFSQCGNAAAAIAAAALYAHGFVYVCLLTAGFSLAAFLLLLWIQEPTRS